MQRTRVLVADDESQLRRTIRRILEGHSCVVREAETGRAAIDEFIRFKPDVMLLDLVLPDMSGIDVCRDIRRTYHEPIIVLSVVGEEAMKIAALDAGADDYVTKPFGSGELLARIRVALRRGATDRHQEPIITADGLRIDLEHHRVHVDEREIHLTPTEFKLLRYLATNAGRLLTHSMILASVWGAANSQDTHILRTYMNQLRGKLGEGGGARRWILTEPGLGYRFIEATTLTPLGSE